MRTLRDWGQSAARAAPWARPAMRSAYRLLPDRWKDTPTSWMQHFFRDAERVTFVQIGAFDGVANDPVREIILASPAWRGLLVEPQPAMFQKLKANYADHTDRLNFLNCAISSEGGSITLHTVPDAEINRLGLGEWVRELATVDRGNIGKRIPGVAVQSVEIDAVTFDDAMRRFGIDTVDCAVIDAEGYDFEIIKSIDLDRYNLKFLLYERAHLSEVDAAEAESLLRNRGFSLRSFGYDTIAWRR